ncbi:MAG: hypothetical protein IKZ87_08640 [Actinomycetaceae bacterium]|nr:hypothetical protein [Actinomycetaceae bacterium]
MGWDWTRGYTVVDIVNDRTCTKKTGVATWKTLAHALVKEGKYNILWSVVEGIYHKDYPECNKKAGDVHRYIACDLIEEWDGGCGYKDMCESVFPFYFSCPLEYFDMVEPANEHWRANVREFHEAKRTRRKFVPIDDATWAMQQAQGTLF